MSFHPKRVLSNLKHRGLLKFDFKMATLRCFFAIKMNLHVVQCILCGQYILATRFLRNSGYLVERVVCFVDFQVSVFIQKKFREI